MSSRVSDILKAISFPMVNDPRLVFMVFIIFFSAVSPNFRTVKVPDLD